MSILRVFRKKRFCGQTVLQDRLIFNKPKIDCKCQKPIKIAKNVNSVSFSENVFYGQTVLPDRSIFN